MTEGTEGESSTLEEQKLLGKLVSLASPQTLPKNFVENHGRIWEAFELGKAYEKEVSKND